MPIRYQGNKVNKETKNNYRPKSFRKKIQKFNPTIYKMQIHHDQVMLML